MSEQATTKKFQGGERTRPAPAERAQKYYPAEDVSAPRKVRSIRRRKHIIRGGQSRILKLESFGHAFMTVHGRWRQRYGKGKLDMDV